MRLFSRYPHIVSILAPIVLAACSAHQNTEISGLGWIKPELIVSHVAQAPVNSDFSLTITDLNGGYSHTWGNIDQFQEYESYQVGSYVARAVSGEEYTEGYGCACYLGETAFQVEEAAQTVVSVECTLSQALWSFDISSSLAEAYPTMEIFAHVADYQYVEVDMAESRPLLLMPGETYFFITLHDDAGRSVSVVPNLSIITAAASSYLLSLDYDSAEGLKVSCGGDTAVVKVDETMFESAGPEISCIGFADDEMIYLTEGYPSEQKLSMVVTESSAQLQSVILTVMADPIGAIDFAGEYDLMGNANAILQTGLETSVSDGSFVVDFTKLLENITINQNTVLTFVMQARDMLQRVSPVAILRATISSLDIELVSQMPAVIGVNKAQIVLQATASDLEERDITLWQLDDFGNVQRQIEIASMTVNETTQQVTLDFEVEPGINAVPVRVDFMDMPKLTVEIQREVPEFSIGVDAFATSAVVEVKAETQEITKALLQYMKIYANGALTTVTTRLPEKNLMWITGLEASRAYTLKAQIISGQREAEAKIQTEAATDMPMGDFEDAEESLKYGGLPCGGKYSAAAFPIYNQQNYTSWDIWWPTKYWASVNAKTFCRQAKNQNSWYMQPSAMLDYEDFVSGAKSIKICSVGWSLDGEEIEPYMQSEGEYLAYNPNVPGVEHRSAGRLFLGSYSFNANTCTETYSEGLGFGSRPYSLNGFYKYEPDANHPDDEAYVEIELINDTAVPAVTIAKASMTFIASPAFKAFNLPIEYDILNVKATRLKVMFCSTVNFGDIEEEDASVSVTADVREAAYRGSVLWIDNLSFAY